MKLIIDIPEQIWEMVVNTGTFGCYRFNTSRAIRKGVPLDKIRAEILKLDDVEYDFDGYYKAVTDALQIIDKYKAEFEPQESEEISDTNLKMWEELFKAESEDKE